MGYEKVKCILNGMDVIRLIVTYATIKNIRTELFFDTNSTNSVSSTPSNSPIAQTTNINTNPMLIQSFIELLNYKKIKTNKNNEETNCEDMIDIVSSVSYKVDTSELARSKQFNLYD